MGATATLMGFVGAAYGFTQTVCRVPLGVFVDIFNLHKKMIVTGAVLSCVSGLGIFITFSPAGFLIFRACAGLASATWLCFTVTYSGYYPKEESSNAMSMIISANHIGKLVGFLIVGTLAASMRNAFLISSAGGVAAIILSLFVKPPPAGGQKYAFKDFIPVVKNKNLIMSAVLALIVHFIMFSTTYQFSPIILINLGADTFILAAVNIVTLSVLILSAVSAGKFLTKRFGEKNLLLFGLACLAVYAVGAGFAKNLAQMFALSVVAGLGEGFSIPMLTGLCIRDIEREKRSTAMGIFSAVYGIGMTVGPVITGVVTDAFNMRTAFVAIGLLAAASLIWSYKNVDTG